jgi:hypothetical protein
MNSMRKPTQVYNLNLHRSDGPSAVPLNAVSWWHVRQAAWECSAAGGAFGLLMVGLLWLGQLAHMRMTPP